tara:strand:- start:11119 stop:11343 length:225 start_codon:yes stop_codon:yes gene_type:complete
MADSYLSALEQAKSHTPINGMVPAVFEYKTLEGKERFGFNFQKEELSVGDRFHIDHGAGIHRNEDGKILWMMQS